MAIATMTSKGRLTLRRGFPRAFPLLSSLRYNPL